MLSLVRLFTHFNLVNSQIVWTLLIYSVIQNIQKLEQRTFASMNTTLIWHISPCYDFIRLCFSYWWLLRFQKYSIKSSRKIFSKKQAGYRPDCNWKWASESKSRKKIHQNNSKVTIINWLNPLSNTFFNQKCFFWNESLLQFEFVRSLNRLQQLIEVVMINFHHWHQTYFLWFLTVVIIVI